MGYMHIENFYRRNQEILLFRQVYALEKVDGSSSHLLWNQGVITPFSGGAKHEAFLAIFNGTNAPTLDTLKAQFVSEFGPEMKVCLYGEVYGGSMQGKSHLYGKELKFIVFDVQVGESWLSVPKADNVAQKFGLEFVDYALVDATIEALDKERDKDSTQAIRNGCGPGHKREGIVVRPPIEVTLNNGSRLIVKHKRDDFEPERKHTPKIDDPEKLKVYEEAEAAVDEFLTASRLNHVLDKVFPGGMEKTIQKTGDVVKAMIEDILREASGEVVDTKELRGAIGKKAAHMFKNVLKGT